MKTASAILVLCCARLCVEAAPTSPPPPPFVITGGCRSSTDSMVYHAAGLTLSGAPYYTDVSTTYYVYWDPCCSGCSGGFGRWILDGDAPNTSALSDLDGSGRCSYWAAFDSEYSSSPPLGKETWRTYCDRSWTTGLLTLAPSPFLPPSPPLNPPAPPYPPYPPSQPPAAPSPPRCWVDSPAAPTVALILVFSGVWLPACIARLRSWGKIKEGVFAKKLSLSEMLKLMLKNMLFGLLVISFPAALPYSIGVATCSVHEWTIFRGAAMYFLVMGPVAVVLAAFANAIFAERARKRLLERLVAVEGELPDVLRHGTIKLLSIDWLIAQPADYILSRRQELPSEAFVSQETAEELLSDGKIAALSYRWIDPKHPDPHGWHLCALRKFLCNKGRRWKALMIDFASLPQKDERGERTDEEDATFKIGLRSMSAVYASPRISVLQHKALPDTSLVPYDRSGWCTFEQAAASLSTTNGGAVYNISSGRVRLKPGKLKSAEEMHEWFHSSSVHFYGSADRDAVSEMYASLFKAVSAFDATRRRKEIRADRMLTHPSSKWRILWITNRLVVSLCIFVFLLPTIFIMNEERQDALQFLFPACICLLILLADLTVSTMGESPICTSYLTAAYHRGLNEEEHSLNRSLGSLCCWDPPFRPKRKITHEGGGDGVDMEDLQESSAVV
mmetsp:Transcript_21557/g.64422  ORF Transcript_21557/g.64422 Transcript_21557/m.64422 type:complete len:673 (+) Transcript_21557:187-2205(+)